MAKEVLEQIPKQLSKIKPLPKPISTSKEIGKIESPPVSNNIPIDGEKIKTVRVGGFFGKVYTVKKVNDKIIYERISTKTTFKSNNSNSTTLSSNSFSKSTPTRTKSQSNFMICQQCGTQVNPNQTKKCPNCGFRIS